jgi:hypothetical protein
MAERDRGRFGKEIEIGRKESNIVKIRERERRRECGRDGAIVL